MRSNGDFSKGYPRKSAGQTGQLSSRCPLFASLNQGTRGLRVHRGSSSYPVQRQRAEDDPPHNQRVLPINLSAVTNRLLMPRSPTSSVKLPSARCHPKAVVCRMKMMIRGNRRLTTITDRSGQDQRAASSGQKTICKTDRDDLRFRVERGYSAASIAKCVDLALTSVLKEVRSQINEKYPKVEIPRKRSLATVPTRDAEVDCYVGSTSVAGLRLRRSLSKRAASLALNNQKFCGGDSAVKARRSMRQNQSDMR